MLAALHQQDPSSIGDAPAPGMGSLVDVTAAIDDLEQRTIRYLGEVPLRVTVLLAWLRSNVVAPTRASIVHGDAGFQNILAAEGRLTALLDWERAHVGDPAEDLAYVKPFVEPVANWVQFLDHYVACGGQRPTDEAIEFYTVWQDTWRAIECAQLAVDFATSRRLETAIAGFVLGPEFLRSALRTALPSAPSP